MFVLTATDNLEIRVMRLTYRIRSLSLTRVIVLALATSTPFGSDAVLTLAQSQQASSESCNSGEQFAGTWHWMFNGKSFSTMILARSGSGFTGTVTPSRIALDDEGGLLRADPSEDDMPTPISQATLEGCKLHITVKDGFAFTVSLKDHTHAEVGPVGAPRNMRAIPAEKVH